MLAINMTEHVIRKTSSGKELQKSRQKAYILQFFRASTMLYRSFINPIIIKELS